MIDEFKFVTKSAQFFIDQIIQPGDIVIDATCGNGNDTLYLSNAVGESGKVFAVDIQEKAINNSKNLLQDKGKFKNVKFILGNHKNLLNLIPEDYHNKISVVMFNLGYLPDSDHKIKTKTESTISAIRMSIRLLKNPGIITVCIYPHSSGLEEAGALIEELKSLTGDLNAYTFKRINRNNPPYLIIITKG